MRKMTATFALAIGGWASVSGAADLPDCKLYKSPAYERGGTYRPHATTRTLELDPAVLKTGQQINYSKDEPVLSSDYRIVRHGTTLVASGDFVLKASWMTNPDFKFVKGQTVTVTRDLVTRDGGGYPVYAPQNGWLMFLTPEGEFCNRAVMVHGGWNEAMGHWTRIPDDARLEWQDEDRAIDAGSLRIIYTGAGAGAIHFQEVWVKGSEIVSSNDRQFDQFAKAVQIAGLEFQIADAKPDSIKVTQAFGSRATLGLR